MGYILGANRFITSAKRTVMGKDVGTLTIVLLAASPGNRLKGAGPISLFKINPDKTLLDYQVNSLRIFYPKSEILVVGGFEFTKLVENSPPNLRLIENENYEGRSVISSLRLAICASPFPNLLVVYGDLLFSYEAIKDLTTKGSLVVTLSDFREKNVGVFSIGGEITTFSYGLPDKWGQIAYFEGDEYKMLRNLIITKKYDKMYLHEVINMIIDGGGHFVNHQTTGKILELASHKDAQKIGEFFE